MGGYQRQLNGYDLCIDHIKLYDEAINIGRFAQSNTLKSDDNAKHLRTITSENNFVFIDH